MKSNFIKNMRNNPWHFFRVLYGLGLTDRLPDKIFLKCMYRCVFQKKLNLSNPQTFNEKMQWLKLYNRKPEYSIMVDKYAAKGYVGSRIGYEHIIPTLGVWDNFDEIDFGTLPNQFVLKCTHDSGGLVICKDKHNLDYESAKKKIEKSLKHDFFLYGREWPYKNVKPRIIAEKYMEDNSAKELRDYKMFCFNGEPKLILVCSERFTEKGLQEDFFDSEWNHTIIQRPRHPNSNAEIAKPCSFEQMKKIARQLSQEIPFLRVDFYEVNGMVYFGEMTSYPASGFERFIPDEVDLELGKLIKLTQ